MGTTISASINAQSQDSTLQKRIEDLEMSNRQLQSESIKLNKRIVVLQNQLEGLKGLSKDVDVIKSDQKAMNDSIKSTSASTQDLHAKIEEADKNITNQNNSIQKKTFWGIIILACALAISLIITILLNNKNKRHLNQIKKEAEVMNEDIVGRLSKEADAMKELLPKIMADQQSPADASSEENLIKALADRITFMEVNLSRMDQNMRGYKQLKRAIEQMKNNLLANGYEIVDLLGKDYNDGMILQANFVNDPNLEKGAQVITNVIRPQINHNGKMIESAQITVSQNIN